MEIKRKLLKNSLLEVKTYFFFKGIWICHKKYCKTLKNVEKLIIQIAYAILLKGFFLNAVNTPKNVEKHVI